MAAPARRHGSFCYADLLRWPGGERWELIDGHAYAMTAPNWAHQSVVFEFGAQLGNQLRHAIAQARSRVGVRLPVAGEADADVRTYVEPEMPMSAPTSSPICWWSATRARSTPAASAARRISSSRCCRPRLPATTRSTSAAPRNAPAYASGG